MPECSNWIDIRPAAALPCDCAFVSERERIAARSMPGLRRRNEWLLWRAVVREHLGSDTIIDYDSVGAPVLLNKEGYISVSHCEHEVAVIYNSAHKCAIDIESLSRRFEKVSGRYLSGRESEILAPFGTAGLAAAWCVKEAVYKYVGEPRAGLLRDIAIRDFDSACGRAVADTPWIEGLVICVEFRPRTVVAVIE